MDAPAPAPVFDRFADALCRQREALIAEWIQSSEPADPPDSSAAAPPETAGSGSRQTMLFDTLVLAIRGTGTGAASGGTESDAAPALRFRDGPAATLRELFALRGIILRDGLDEFLRSELAALPHARALETRISHFFEGIAAAAVQRFAEEEAHTQRGLSDHLAETSAALARMDASRLQMLRTVAHEMGNMLHALSGAVSILHAEYEELDAAERREMLGICQRNLAELKALLTHLTDFSAFLRGRAQREVTTFYLPTLFAELTRNFRTLAEAQGVRFEAAIDPDLGEVRSDRLRIRQIVTNLVSNAIKYRQRNPPPGTPPSQVLLAFRARPADAPDHWQIAVEDNGVGIAPDQREAIFEPFHRLSPKSEAPGAGLGLAISKRLAELLGGQLTVESELGRGSCFEVTLPLRLPLTQAR